MNQTPTGSSISNKQVVLFTLLLTAALLLCVPYSYYAAPIAFAAVYKRFALICYWFNYLLFEYPLLMLYMHGPTLNGFGFWEGRSLSDICSVLTNVPSLHWTASRDNVLECASLIDRKFQSLMVMLYFVVYMSMLLTTLTSLYKHCLRNALRSSSKKGHMSS